MADNHGNTPAAWTAVSVAMLGFLVGSIALMLDPVRMPMFWVGVALAVAALPIFLVMGKMGLHGHAQQTGDVQAGHRGGHTSDAHR